MFNRQLREMIIALETIGKARWEEAEKYRARVEVSLQNHFVQSEKKASEDAIIHEQIRSSISRVHSRIDRIVWKIITWQSALIALGLSVIGYLLINGVPWK